jgi:hypothetical protein
MTIKSGQKIYRIRGPDGLWARKTGSLSKIEWVENEDSGTFWKKLHHIKKSLTQGVLSDPKVLEGVPFAALKVYEYDVTIVRSGRINRITELKRFYPEKST